MNKITKQTIRKTTFTCSECGHESFKKKIVTFPFFVPGGKQINVERTPVTECLKCQNLVPTQKGKEKLARCLGAFMMLPE